jgi:hypothetical protein
MPITIDQIYNTHIFHQLLEVLILKPLGTQTSATLSLSEGNPYRLIVCELFLLQDLNIAMLMQ